MLSYITNLPVAPDAASASKEKPIDIFAAWFEEAREAGIREPSAVILATASKCGMPSCRVVLLKDFDEGGFVIYTNMNSRKGREIKHNPQAALCFYWPETGKQIRIEGYTTYVGDTDADKYFASRPLKSRIGAWASQQSEPLEDVSDLMKRIAYYTAKVTMGTIGRPPHWGGVRIVPDYFEFWQETDRKIAERMVFYKREDVWHTTLLNP